MSKTTVTVRYTEEEIEDILRDALGIPDNADLFFHVEGEEDLGDWQAALPLSYVFKGVSFTREE